MKRTEHTVMRDEVTQAPADLQGVNFIYVERLSWAVELRNNMQWIDIGNGMDLFLHKKSSFPLRISSVNVTKSARNYVFGHIY